MKRAWQEFMRKYGGFAAFGLALGLWAFFFWGSEHSALTGHALFFRERELRTVPLALAWLFRLFEWRGWEYSSAALFALALLTLLWRGLKVLGVTRRVIRILQFVVVYVLTATETGIQTFHWEMRDYYISPESSPPFFQAGWWVVAVRIIPPSLMVALPALLLLEWIVTRLEHSTGTPSDLFKRWTGYALTWVVFEVACVTAVLYWQRAFVTAVLEFGDYFIRLPFFLCFGLLLTILVRGFARSTATDSGLGMWKAVGVVAVQCAILCAPAVWYIQANQVPQTPAPSPVGTVRSQLLASSDGHRLQSFDQMSESYLESRASLLPADPEITLRRYHMDEPQPVGWVMRPYFNEYPSIRERALAKVRNQPYAASGALAYSILYISREDPYLSTSDAERMFHAFMDMKDTFPALHRRLIVFAFEHNLPDAEEAREDFVRRANWLAALFADAGSNVAENLRLLEQDAAVARKNAFSTWRGGHASGVIQFEPEVLSPGADLRRVWVSLAPSMTKPGPGGSTYAMDLTHFPYAMNVTHFPLGRDGEFTIDGLPSRTYRLLVDVPSDILANPLETSIVDFPADVIISPEKPKEDLGTIRFARSVKVLSPDLIDHAPPTPVEVELAPYPGADSYEALYCVLFAGVERERSPSATLLPATSPGGCPLPDRSGRSIAAGENPRHTIQNTRVHRDLRSDHPSAGHHGAADCELDTAVHPSGTRTAEEVEHVGCAAMNAVLG